MSSQIKEFSTPTILFQAAAQDFLERSLDIIQKKGWCNIVLSGGNTPKNFYAAITENEALKNKIQWDKMRFFFGDERYVSSDDAQSNYHTAKEYLFSKVPVLEENIYRVRTELKTAADAAMQYEQTLKNIFKLEAGQHPPFDITYLGMGDDAHTASLMPFTDIVNAYVNNPNLPGLVKSLWVDKLNMFRITLTPPAINHSTYVIFLVEGKNKAAALKVVLQDRHNPQQHPALLIKEAIWFVDQAAASQLEKSK